MTEGKASAFIWVIRSQIQPHPLSPTRCDYGNDRSLLLHASTPPHPVFHWDFMTSHVSSTAHRSCLCFLFSCDEKSFILYLFYRYMSLSRFTPPLFFSSFYLFHLGLLLKISPNFVDVYFRSNLEKIFWVFLGGGWWLWFNGQRAVIMRANMPIGPF